MDYDQITISAFIYEIISCDSIYLIIFLFTLAWQGTFAKYKYRSKNSYCLQMTDEN